MKNRFLAAESDSIIPGKPALLGCPLDLTSTYRSGLNFSTQAIREASDSIETYSPLFEKDLEDLPFADVGDLDFTYDSIEASITKIADSVTDILVENGKPLIFGGEHTISLGVIQALIKKYPSLKIVHLDAHTDLRNDYEGAELNHSTVMKRISEIVPPSNIVQLGIRSGTKAEFQWMKQHQTLLEWTPGSEKILLDRLGDNPTHITLDLDVFDPACLPGTGNPESGGWFYVDMERFLRASRFLNIVCIDVLELNPTLDSSGNSSVLAAKLIRELLIILSEASAQ